MEEDVEFNSDLKAKLVLEELKLIRHGHITTRDEGEAKHVAAAEGIFPSTPTCCPWNNGEHGRRSLNRMLKLATGRTYVAASAVRGK